MTALHYAADYGHEEIVELLLAKEADVNAKADDGETPLDTATPSAADLLLSQGGSACFERFSPLGTGDRVEKIITLDRFDHRHQGNV